MYYFIFKVSTTSTKCKIENELCLCDVFNSTSIIKLECVEKSNTDFIQNQIQAAGFYTLIELSVKNKVIENISTSNLKQFLSVNLKFLAINNCGIKSINKGIFNNMIQLSNLSLTDNEIDSMENNSFFTEPFESHLIELYLSNNKLRKIHRELFNGLSKLEILCLDNNNITEIDVDSFEKAWYSQC